MVDVKKWDERIRKDLEYRMGKFDKTWRKSRAVVRNADEGRLNGNLVQEFVETIQSRLIVRNPVIKVKADSADYSKKATELEIASNAVTRVIDMKFHLTQATLSAAWASTGWVECGHTMDQHSFDPMRSVLYRSPNAEGVDVEVGEDNYVPVAEEEVVAHLGREAENVPPFDPFEPAPVAPEPTEEPPPPFDPELGMPWLKEVNPFLVVLPKVCRKFGDSDYVTKLVVISKPELELLTSINVENVSVSHKYKPLLNEVSGHEYIDDPVLLCVTHIRRDRNAPEYTNWYLAHVLGHPSVVIKSAPNPYGGLIPLVPISISPSKNVWDTTLVENIHQYAEWYSAGVEAMGDRLYESLNQKVVTGAGASMEAEETRKLLNPKYKGEVKVQGDPTQIRPYNGPGVAPEVMQLLSIFQSLAQGASGASDLDRGKAVKRITARQTEALLNATGMRVDGMRATIGRAAKEVVVKVMHLVGIFSLYRSRRFTFGTRVATLEPGVNDYTTSYSYNIDVRDMAPPENAEGQLVLVQFLRLLMMDPTPERLLVGQWDWQELAEMIRVRFDFPPEVRQRQDLQQLQQPPMPGMGGMPGQPGGEAAMGGPEHAERFPGDQGVPDMNNLMAGLRAQN